MSMNRPKQGVSVQSFYVNQGLEVRLEYNHKEEKQSVFLNDRLMSSFKCPPGKLAYHTFRATDSMSASEVFFGAYRIIFAVEPETNQIRFQITRKNTGGEDTKWYLCDRNVEPNSGWNKFQAINEDVIHEPDERDEEGKPKDSKTTPRGSKGQIQEQQD